MKTNQPVRLVATLSGEPGQRALLQLLREAEKRPNSAVQVVWTIGERDSYTLTCLVPKGGGMAIQLATAHEIPQWTLCREAQADVDQKQLFTHSTRDLALVQNLISDQLRSIQKIATQLASNQGQGLTNSNDQLPVFNPTQQVAAAGGEQEDSGQLNLSGDLANVKIANVFQSISICGMTGKLKLYHKLFQAEVYFNDGVIVDAGAHNPVSGLGLKQEPEELLLDLFTWDAGTFRFQPGWTSSQVTVSRSLDSFISEASVLLGYANELKAKGLSRKSVLNRDLVDATNYPSGLPMVAEIPVDAELQKTVYSQIGIDTPVSEITSSLSRSKWLPILYNLISSGIVTIGATTRRSHSDLEPFFRDDNLTSNASLGLARPETGLVSLPFFLYFLKEEFARHRKTRHPFSLVVLDIEGTDHSCLKSDMDILAGCFNELKEEYDLFAHFETLGIREFAMLLPYRSLPAAFLFVDQFLFRLRPRAIHALNKIVAGIASTPEDGADPATLVAAARHAKDLSRVNHRQLSTYRGIELQPWESLRQKGDMAIACEKLDDASDIWLSALTEAEQFPEDDPRLLMTLDRLSSIYMIQGKYSMSEPLLKLSLELRREARLHTELINTLSQLAKCCYEQRKYHESEQYMLASIKLCEQLFGPGHAALGDAYHNLATLYHIQDMFEPGREAYEKALYLQRKAFGDDHPATIKIAQNYAKLMRSQDEAASAVITGSWKRIDWPEQ